MSYKVASLGLISDVCYSMIGHGSVVLLGTGQVAGNLRNSCVIHLYLAYTSPLNTSLSSKFINLARPPHLVKQ